MLDEIISIKCLNITKKLVFSWSQLNLIKTISPNISNYHLGLIIIPTVG